MYLLIFLIIYSYISFTLMKIFQKGQAIHFWLAWIPVAREYELVNLVGKSWRWIILFFIPIVNIFMSWIVWGVIANKIGRSRWWGRLMIIPFLNLFILAVLAFELDPKSWPGRLRKYYQARKLKEKLGDLSKNPELENGERK